VHKAFENQQQTQRKRSMNTPLVKRAYNLGLKAVPNFAEVLSEGQVAYYEEHLDELQAALRRGFIIPTPETAAVIESAPPALFKIADTDLDHWLDQTEKFAKKHLGITIDLRKRFAIPAELPWKSVIPVFDPGNMTNRQMVENALKGPGHDVWEETDVMKYDGSQASKEPTLHFIENSIRPNADTMNMSPNQLRKTGKLYLRLRGYGLAFAVHKFATNKPLDPETFTWFPEDRLSDGYVAFGNWYPDDRQVGFSWSSPDGRDSGSGARVAMPIPLKP
jgi:hypothetical protein